MAFYIFFLCGIAGGVLGGMGMGGGTALIPLLTIFCGVEQGAAQGINLLSFLPMSFVALGIHAKTGLLKKEGLLWIVAPALVASALFSVLAAYLPSEVLKKGFGAFLIVLSVFEVRSALREKNTNRQK